MPSKLLYILSLLLLCSCANQRKEVVAKVNGKDIYLEELSQKTKQEIFDLLNFSYEIKIQALDDLIKQKLLNTEAENKKMTLDQYLNWYINSKTEFKEVSLAQNIHSIFSKDKSRNMIISYLVDSLYDKAHVQKFIYPPQRPECVIRDLPIHYRGNLSSPVSFIVVSDFTCERCIEFDKTARRIFKKYQQEVKFGYVNFSGSPTLASLACEAADKQNRFWEFHDAFFKNRKMVDSTFVHSLVDSFGMEMKQFTQDLRSNELYDKQIRTIDELVKRGLFATPTIIIDDRLVYMTNSYEELTKLLDHELQNE